MHNKGLPTLTDLSGLYESRRASVGVIRMLEGVVVLTR